MPARLGIERLTKGFHREDGSWMPVLNEVTLEAEGLVCILGPSGCGKSTVLNIVAGIEAADTGEIQLLSERVTDRAAVVGYVFQDPRLLPWKTVKENLFFALRGMGVPRQRWGERANRYLNLVHLSDFQDQYPPYLSGGMRQRVGLARALVIEPDVLLLDEPFSRLDEITARRLRQEFLEIQAMLRQTVLFVTHNAAEAAVIGDTIYVLSSRPARIVGRIENPIRSRRHSEDAQLRDIEGAILRLLEEKSEVGRETEEIRDSAEPHGSIKR